MKKGTKINNSGLTPVKTYYQFNAPETPNPKYNVKVIQKGQEISGKYVDVIFDKEFNPEKPTQTHVIETFNEGKVTIKGCTSLNVALAEIGIGNLTSIVYQGKGKPSKPGRKPPYLFDVYPLEDDEDSTLASAIKTNTSPVEDETEDSDSDELPF